MMLDKVRETIKTNSLFDNGDKVLCAVSGGADSICLLNIMQKFREEFNLSIYVANVNHLIRGEESDRDSNFVQKVCKEVGIKCFYREYDVQSIAKQRKLGEEECGRILRYEFFEEISRSLGGVKIATAHNLNDNAETVLFRLTRGSSSRGLSGIKYKRGNIVRPLLDVSREEIEAYLKSEGISWCEDSTNKIEIYARNKLRLSVVPLLKKISGKAEEHIVSAAKLISEDNSFLDDMAKKARDECFFGEYLLCKNFSENPEPIKRRIAADVLQEWGAEEITTDKVKTFLSFVTIESGKKFDINAVFYAEKSYDRIILLKKEVSCDFSSVFSEVCIGDNWEIKTYFSKETIKKKNNNIAVFDGDKLSLPLTVRYRRTGDRMSPLGMNGTKKLSDVFSDAKVEKHRRDKVPIVEKDGKILFVCGLRQSSDFSVDNATANYIVIEYIPKIN